MLRSRPPGVKPGVRPEGRPVIEFGWSSARQASVLETSLWVPRPPEVVFPFFAEASNLGRITPPFLHFRILTPLPIRMDRGTLIDYRIRLRGIPFGWRTAITAWEPPRRFVDEQLRGPYRLWIHEHTFTEENGGTLCGDRVTYRVPGGRLVERWLVRGDLGRIFQFRARVLEGTFGREEENAT